MDITYLGHASFRIKGKNALIVTDPYASSVGFDMPKVSADIVTVSHQHDDHNEVKKVSATSKRETPYIISAPGEYEINEVGIFGWGSFHDDKQGEERGKNTIYMMHVDGIRIAHLGDLGHPLTKQLINQLEEVDVLMIPVGGHYTINAQQAAKVVDALQPGIVIPMHFKTKEHDQKVFGELTGLETFLEATGADSTLESIDKLSLNQSDIPEETQVVVLKKK